MLTQEQGDAVLAQLDANYQILFTKAQGNVDNLAQHGFVGGILNVFSLGGETQREDLIKQELETVKQMGDQVAALREMLPGAIADDAMGDRWIDAAKNFERRLKDALPDLETKSVTQILKDSLSTAAQWAGKGVSETLNLVPQILPTWLIVVVVGGVGLYIFFQFQRIRQ